MHDIEFNLIDEPWIRVSNQDGTVEEIGIRDILINAHQYRGLAGELDSQNIAVLRMLIALIHTAITNPIEEGHEKVANDEQGIECWKKIWNEGCLPKNIISNYLDKWHERFWLFHPDFPFFQVNRAEKGTKNESSKLNGALSESNNKKRLFSFVSREGKQYLSYSESARWLLFLNGFDDRSAKQKFEEEGKKRFTVGWLGKLGLIIADGVNLFETLMLNMPMFYGLDMSLWTEDKPVWEQKEVRDGERMTIEMPDNLAGLYTLQSRRILLKRENGYVSGYGILGGDSFSEANAVTEPMTLWELNTKESPAVYLPLRHVRNKYIWRNFTSITGSENFDMRPGIVNWCRYLQKNHIIPKNRIITFATTCVRYDSNQSGSITDSFSDKVIFRADLISDAGKYWVKEVNEQLGKIKKASNTVSNFVYGLRMADGLNPKEKEPIERARELLYSEVDYHFRKWILLLDSEQDSEERNTLLCELESTIRDCALETGRVLFEQSGDSAFVGRVEKNDKNKKIIHYSSANEYRRFKKKIWEIYPSKKGVEEVGKQ